MRSWVDGSEDVEAFSKDPFESMEAQIISSGKGKVMGVGDVTGGARGGGGELRIAVFGSGGRIPTGVKGLGEVTGVGM